MRRARGAAKRMSAIASVTTNVLKSGRYPMRTATAIFPTDVLMSVLCTSRPRPLRRQAIVLIVELGRIRVPGRKHLDDRDYVNKGSPMAARPVWLSAVRLGFNAGSLSPKD